MIGYSIDNPRSYLESNIIGTFNILEAVKNGDINHTLIASTSSAYGANKEMPFDEAKQIIKCLFMLQARKLAKLFHIHILIFIIYQLQILDSLQSVVHRRPEAWLYLSLLKLCMNKNLMIFIIMVK